MKNGWKDEEFDYYIIYFKNTPVGLKHAFDKYYSLRSEYKTDDCTDNSGLSRYHNPFLYLKGIISIDISQRVSKVYILKLKSDVHFYSFGGMRNRE